MSQTVTGYVETVAERTGTSKKGKPWTIYGVRVDGQTFSAGFDKPNVKQGDYVTLTIDKDDRGYDAIKAIAQATPPVQTAAVAAAAHPAGDRNSSIVYQSSRKDAVELVKLLVDTDALPVTAAKTAAGKAARYEEMMALVDKLTVQLFYDVITLRQLDRVQDAGAEGPAPAALPEDDAPETDGKWE